MIGNPMAKKSLGQNFLTSIPARIAIVKAGNINKNDIILEIGPGKGFLTEGLLESGAEIVALEKDRDLLPILSEKFSKEISSRQLLLIEGDALNFPEKYLEKLGNSYKLIANIPYYITGAILRYYLSKNNQPSQMVVLVQKEVAERVVAKDGKESMLSLSIKVYGIPKIVYRVNKGSFYPVPKVDSAVLSIENISRNNFNNQYHEDIFFKCIHSGFSHKRKFMLSNMKADFSKIDLKSIFEESGIKDNARAEDVTLSQWLQLSSNISTQS